MPTFYQPRDTRFWGEGVDFGFGLQLAERFRMGARFEYLTARGRDTLAGPPIAPAVGVGDGVAVGITALCRAYEVSEHAFGADVGLWTGSITTGQIGNQGVATFVTKRMSPFIEPMIQALYGLGPQKAAQIKVGLGYRFIRNFPTVVAPFGAGSRNLTDFDGLDIQFGVGYSF